MKQEKEQHKIKKYTTPTIELTTVDLIKPIAYSVEVSDGSGRQHGGAKENILDINVNKPKTTAMNEEEEETTEGSTPLTYKFNIWED